MARSRMYFARSGVVIDGYYAAYGFTADVSRWPSPRSGFVQPDRCRQAFGCTQQCEPYYAREHNAAAGE